MGSGAISAGKGGGNPRHDDRNQGKTCSEESQRNHIEKIDVETSSQLSQKKQIEHRPNISTS